MSVRLLTPIEAAELLRTTRATLADMRFKGTGPRFIKPGARSVLYREEDILAWLDQNTVETKNPAGRRGLVKGKNL